MSMDYVMIRKLSDSAFLVCHEDRLKVLKEITAGDVPVYEKIKNLKSDNLAEVYDVFCDDGKYYVLREYAQGTVLCDYLEQHGTVSAQFAEDTVSGICDGLTALHGAGIVHRDITPNNIVLCPEPKLIDYGISRTIKANKGRDTEILGTRGFAAPEQFGFHQTGPEADIYSVGVLLNYMLTGRYPYEKIAAGRFERIIRKCTQIDDTKRYESAAQLKSAVKRHGVSAALSKLPGFRQDLLWQEIPTTIYIIGVVLYFIFSVGFSLKDKEYTTALVWIWWVGFCLIAPPLLLFDCNYWSKKMPYLRDSSKNKRFCFRLFAFVVSVIISFVPFIFT